MRLKNLRVARILTNIRGVKTSVNWYKIVILALLGVVLFMAHGQPDFGMYGIAATIYRLSDMGELAARLGSINTFDRRGDVIFLTSFEEGLIGWYPGGVGTGYSVTQSADYARNGMCSCKMVAGSDSTRVATLTRRLPFPVLSNVGVEFSFIIHAAVTYLHLGISLYDGTEYNQATIRYDQDNDRLYYADSNLDYQLLTATAKIDDIAYLFHTIKLVVDYENNKYKRLLVDNTEYSLADLGLYSAASADGPVMSIFINVYGASGTNATIYVDDFIVTQNEP